MSKIPTIAMIPSGYKANKVYSVLPTNGDADLATTRASTATRVNQLGLIEEVATGVPRLDYSDGGCPSLLVEPQSTNLITYSEDFSNASWTKFGSSLSANAVSSPKGDLTADKLIEDTGSSIKRFSSSVSIISGNEYTASVFVKAAERSNILLRNNDGITDVDTYFNLSTVSVTSGVGFIEDFGNGWYRISKTFTATSSTTSAFNFQLLIVESGTTTSYTGDGTSGIYIWGAQFEEQSYATSYIPTNGATATRVAETASKTGLENYINSSEGVLYLESKALADDGTNRFLSIHDGTTSNYLYFRYVSTLNTVLARFLIGGTTIDLSDNITTTEFHKIAIKWKSGDFALWIDGVKVDTNTNLAIFNSNTLSNIEFSFPTNGGNEFPSKIKDLRVYNQALTDSELQTLTS